MFFIVVKCVFSLYLMISNSTKCFLFNAFGNTLTSLIIIPSLVFWLLSSFILRKLPHSNIVVEISGLCFWNCSISLTVGGKLIFSMFNRSQHLNNY